MVCCLHNDDVGGEIRAQQQAQGLDYVGPLRLAARDAELGELLVGAKHDKVGSEDHPGLLLLVVIDLHGSVMGHTEIDDARLVANRHRFDPLPAVRPEENDGIQTVMKYS